MRRKLLFADRDHGHAHYRREGELKCQYLFSEVRMRQFAGFCQSRLCGRQSGSQRPHAAKIAWWLEQRI
jgi:hypothetical protein